MSSTCVSNPSVEDISCDWLDYHDLHDFSRVGSYERDQGLTMDGESAVGYFEGESFVCIDVALESWEEARKDTKTVPKRQIQLKRHSAKEPQADTERNLDAGSTAARKNTKDLCLRQHSSPAAIQEAWHKAALWSHSSDRKQKLQKSFSLDETSSRTEMATCLIKSVLSKKMQYENDLQHSQAPEGHFCPFKVKSEDSQSSDFFLLSKTPNTKVSNVNSSFAAPIYNGSSSQEFPFKAKADSPAEPTKQCSKAKSGTGKVKRGSKPGCVNTEKRDPGEEQRQVVPDDQEARPCSGFGKARPGSTPTTTSTRAPGIQSGMTNKALECHTGLEDHGQQSTKCFEPEIPEIAPKHCTAKENKSPSLNVTLLLGQETQTEVNPELVSTESTVGSGHQTKSGEHHVVDQAATGEISGKNKIRAPTHKVRDLRKLVKNSYDLQFKGTDTPGQNHVLLNKPRVSAQPMDDGQCVKKVKRPEESRLNSAAPPNHKLNPTKGRFPVSFFLKEKGNQATLKAQDMAPVIPLPTSKMTLPSPVASTAALRCGSDTRANSTSSTQTIQPAAKEAPVRAKDGTGQLPSTTALDVQLNHPSNSPDLASLSSTEYGNEGTRMSSLVFEQSPSHILLDPTTGKYFYFKVATQPLCKMLFDPETGQYVTVQVPQQMAVYHGLYPPCTAAYPFLRYQSLYTPSFLPYSAGYFGAPVPIENQP